MTPVIPEKTSAGRTSVCRVGSKTDTRILGEGEHPRAATGEQKGEACNRSSGECQKPKMGSHAHKERCRRNAETLGRDAPRTGGFGGRTAPCAGGFGERVAIGRDATIEGCVIPCGRALLFVIHRHAS